MKKLDQKGLSAIEGILIFVIVGLIVGVGWYVWQSSATKEDNSNSQLSNVSKDQSFEMHGVTVTFKDEASFEDGDVPLITSRIVNPMIDYHKSVAKDDLNQIIVGRNAESYGPDDSRYVLSQYYESSEANGLGFVFGMNNKIEYWQPELCDPGGCLPYPELLKEKYPETYKAYQTCEAENKKIDKDERSQETVCI